MLAPHIPHRIGKKVASRKKVGSAEKKHACRFSKPRIYQIAASGKPAIGGSVVARIPKWGHTWHETNKKSRYGGDVRADALLWV